MGFRYYRRLNIGKGFGFNLSKSGLSTSYRTKYGSIGPKGFSIRTGIPGLSYRGAKSGDALLILLVIAICSVGLLIAWNLLLFILWAAKETYHFILRIILSHQINANGTLSNPVKAIPSSPSFWKALGQEASARKSWGWAAVIASLVLFSVLSDHPEQKDLTAPVAQNNISIHSPPKVDKTAALSSKKNAFLDSSSIHEWHSKSDGNPATYVLNNVKLTLYSEATAPSVPLIKIEVPGMETKVFKGQATSDDTAASFAIAKIDPISDSPQIIFLTYSGGAHCCTNITVFEKSGFAWKQIDLGNWDGSPMPELPKDIDGDGTPDIVVRDDAFNYKFAPYSDSFAPPKIFNLVDGVLLDVSDNSRYAPLFRHEFEQDKAACLNHSNGGCAAFLAIAYRLGSQAEARNILLSNYNKESMWGLEGPCTVEAVNGVCPSGEEGPMQAFPDALDHFLFANHYSNATDSQEITRDAPAVSNVSPSFDCTRVHSDVLLLICSNQNLATVDQELAKSYALAIQHSANPQAIRQDEISWIQRRNNSTAEEAKLLEMYHDRIAELNQTVGSIEEDSKDTAPDPQ